MILMASYASQRMLFGSQTSRAGHGSSKSRTTSSLCQSRESFSEHLLFIQALTMLPISLSQLRKQLPVQPGQAEIPADEVDGRVRLDTYRDGGAAVVRGVQCICSISTLLRSPAWHNRILSTQPGQVRSADPT